MCRDEGRGPTGQPPAAPRVEVVTPLPRSRLCLNPQLPKPNKPQLLRLQRPRLAARAPGGPREKGPDAARARL